MRKSSTPLHQLIPQRIKKALLRLESSIWEMQRDIPVSAASPSERFLPVEEAARLAFRSVKAGQYFAKQGWSQTWFKLDLPKAQAAEKGRRYLSWHANGETTVYVDAKPWAGLDACHLSCPLPDEACTLFLDCGNYQTGIWEGAIPNPSAHGLQFNFARLGIRNEEAFGLYWDLEVLLELVEQLRASIGHTTPKGGFGYIRPIEKTPPLLRQLLKRLDDAIDLVDQGELKSFGRTLKAIYADYPAESWGMTVSYVGHAHIDLVWLWPEVVTGRKGVHTCATVLRLMEKYPEFIFTMSQPALLNKIKESEPALFQAVKKRIRDGRLEATGGFEVESDNTIPCGESLLRSLRYGQDRFKELRGEYSNTVWLPDVFGYSQCLPQVFAAGGIQHFYTTKILWSSVTKFPHNSFVWQGADGSEVVAHLATAGYNSMITVQEASDCVAEYRQSDVSSEVLVAAGYGDGGGGPTEGHCERARRLRSLASVPKVGWSSVEEYFHRLDAIREELPVYRGELYLEYHRGTYTTQGRFKRAFRALERALQAHEAVRVVTGGKVLNRDTWLRSIFAQFHDAIPGSSIGRVYEELGGELQDLVEHESEAARVELQKAAKREKNALSIFNPSLLFRQNVLEFTVPGAGDYRLLDESGAEYPTQCIGSGKERTLLASVPLQGLEVKTVTLQKSSPVPVEYRVEASPTHLDNGVIGAAFTKGGELASISIEGVPLPISGAAGLILCEDNPAEFDAWDIDQSATWLKKKVCRDLKLKLVEQGPVRAVLQATGTVGEKSSLCLEYILEEHSPFLKVRVSVDWQENHKLLRFEIPTALATRFARYGCPFGSIERNQLSGTQAEEAKWEVPGSRWMALPDGADSGIALITESKYGFSCKDGVIGLSLLRSPKDPDPTADIGWHQIEFAIGAYAPVTDEDTLSTAAAAESVFGVPLVVDGAVELSAPLTFDSLGSVVPAWILPAETTKGYVVRLHECAGRSARPKLRLSREPKSVQIVDLFERPVRKALTIQDGQCEVTMGAYEMLSLLISI